MSRRDPISRTLLDQLVPAEPRQSQLRRIQILEAAIRCFARHGPEESTYDRIAAEAEVSRALVQHYFASKDEMMTLAATYVRARMQEVAVEAIGRAEGPRDRMAAYVGSTFDWLKRHPAPARAWLAFLQQCSVQLARRRHHSGLIEIGQERIRALIDDGVAAGQFRCADPVETARFVHVIITGALVTLVTESEGPSLEDVRRATVARVLQWLGVDEPGTEAGDGGAGSTRRR